ncbi:hypothetical protein [Brevibacterium casei]|uniref:hypothetical protein n=1 Tax=Brevibacterium casei TaxID=33889 RepID=UPI0011AF07D4|nr:hypothetical protein [Brevibacterium casei]QPR38019.1 hypothetical protein I6G94_10370 [Brevibacterium casei]QPR45310.1 hypothetical protein I6G93_08010 [Brevibacterium casei]
MDLALLLSNFVAPIVVGVGLGWISNRWSSSHGWLRAEVQSRSSYYADVLVAGQELRETLPQMYEHAEQLRSEEFREDECESDPAYLHDRERVEALAESVVASWRRQVAKAPLYAAAVVATPIQASGDALERALDAFHEVDPLPMLNLRCEILHEWTTAVEGSIERDMVDMRLSAVRGLPWRQRRAERSHLKEMSKVLEVRIHGTVRDISALAEEIERAEQADEADCDEG